MKVEEMYEEMYELILIYFSWRVVKYFIVFIF